jgi:hypothetical protein
MRQTNYFFITVQFNAIWLHFYLTGNAPEEENTATEASPTDEGEEEVTESGEDEDAPEETNENKKLDVNLGTE